MARNRRHQGLGWLSSRFVNEASPDPESPPSERSGRSSARNKRIVLYLLIALGIGVYLRAPRPWITEREHITQHFRIESRTSAAQGERLGLAGEALYAAYLRRFGGLPGFKQEHPLLLLRIYRDRDDFRRINPDASWAEAFYYRGTCHQYIKDGPSPYQWAIHEITHQLNTDVAGRDLAKWLSEGTATYFAASLLIDGQLELGAIDIKCYPVFWLADLKLTGDSAVDARANQFIPLQSIVTNEGGPSLDEHFNTYYVHWWALVHFLHHHENGRWVGAVDKLMLANGSAEAFQEHVGSFAQIEPVFYEYLRGYAALGPRWSKIRVPVRRPGVWPTWPARKTGSQTNTKRR